VGDPPLSPDEAYEVRVSRRALESFVGTHGGTLAQAEAELRSMLEDFLLVRAWKCKGDRWILTRRSYTLVLSGDGSTIVSYSTAHRERSWSQVKAGVRSRITSANRRLNSQQRNLPGYRLLEGPMIDEAALRAIDPASLLTNSLALRNFRRACRDGHGSLNSDSKFQDVLASDLRYADVVLRSSAPETALWVVRGPDIRWGIRGDGQRLISSAIAVVGAPATADRSKE
jgi:hypothetical protein